MSMTVAVVAIARLVIYVHPIVVVHRDYLNYVAIFVVQMVGSAQKMGKCAFRPILPFAPISIVNRVRYALLINNACLSIVNYATMVIGASQVCTAQVRPVVNIMRQLNVAIFVAQVVGSVLAMVKPVLCRGQNTAAIQIHGACQVRLV